MRSPPRITGLLLAVAGVAAGFALILGIGFALDHHAAPARGPVFGPDGMPVPIAAGNAPPATPISAGDTKLDMAARFLLPATVFKVFEPVVTILGVIVLLYAGVRVAQRRLRGRNPRPGGTPPAAAVDPGRLLNLNEIQERVERLAQTIQAPVKTLPSYGRSEDFGHAHIEVDHAYHWITVERGVELKRRTTRDLDELLYFIFEAVTFSMALDVEVSRRRKNEDFRRQLFDVNLSLLARLQPSWAARRRIELNEILALNPFSDGKLPGL